MQISRRILSWKNWAAITGVLLLFAWQNSNFQHATTAEAPSSQSALRAWLKREPGRVSEFAAFEKFLEEEGVSGVVPAWQLARLDRFYVGRCDISPWVIPPRDHWPNIVPALKLVREQVKPAVGEVSVQSAYRTPELNKCARGATRSHHLRFGALDLQLVKPRKDQRSLYRDLCAMHRDAGPDSRMGLGAYFDPRAERVNSNGRFHIDAAGYRTWGRSYTSASSPCGKLD